MGTSLFYYQCTKYVTAVGWEIKTEQKKNYYSDYKKGPFARHLDKYCLNNICGMNERCWKKAKEKFLKK